MPRAIRIEKTCDHCGQTFLIKPSHDFRRFCSRVCWKAHEAIHGRPAAKVDATEFPCKTCGQPFFFKPAYLTEYRRKFGKDPMYCSIECSAIGRRADTEARSVFTCLQCGKVNSMRRYQGAGRSVYYREQKFCDQTCKVAWQMAKAAERFTAGHIGRHVKRNGYIWISIPANIAGGKKREMLEHRWVMEQAIGRPLLKGETVHHVNGDRSDNRISNIELFSDRHGPGQRVVDKVAFAIEMLRLYPDFALAAGVRLVDVPPGEHPLTSPYSGRDEH